MKSKSVLIRVILILLAMIVALLYIGPLVTTGELNIGVLTGLGFAVVLTLYAMLFEPVNKAVKGFNQKKAGKIATSVICTVLALGIGVGGFAFANVAKHSTANEKQTDYVIVLGCMVRGDRPGIFLSKRINKAYEYLNKYPEAYAVLSGGHYHPMHHEFPEHLGSPADSGGTAGPDIWPQGRMDSHVRGAVFQRIDIPGKIRTRQMVKNKTNNSWI